MKKFLFALTAVTAILLCLLLSSCGSTTTSDPGYKTLPSQSESSDDPSEPTEAPTAPTTPASETEEPTSPDGPVVPIESIKLSRTSLSVMAGKISSVVAIFTPSNATDQTLTWTSTDESVATVENGKITGQKEGVATVTATTKSGLSASVEVTVTKYRVPLQKLTLDQTSLSLTENTDATLYVTYTPETTTDRELTWSSDNEQVATVDKNGKVTAHKEGVATITATSKEAGISAVCKITVILENAPVAGVVISRSDASISLNGVLQLTARVLPDNAGNKNVTWESSDESVATVDANGVVKGIKLGTATVTVKTKEGEKSASCKITVVDKPADPMDAIDMSKSQSITDLGYYAEGLRVKTSGELLFSPNLTELRRIVRSAADYNNYLGYIRFTYLPAEDGEVEYTYHSIALTPVQSKGDWVDFFLQGEEADCGFCPIAEMSYRVELIVVKTSAPTVALFDGVYEMTTSPDYASSKYYNPTDIGGQTVREEGQYYIRYVASAHGTIAGNTKQLLGKGEVSTEVIAVPDSGYKFVMWSDGVLTPARSGDSVTRDTKLTASFTVDMGESAIPAIYIFTETGRPVTQKNYERATVTVTNANKDKQNVSNVPTQIKGRGNSSWNGGAAQTNYDSKNSYHLKFDEGIKLIGIGDSKNRDWVLNSNKFDLSGLRNWMVWDLANKMGTLPYVPEGKLVQLYVNSQYRGMYMVSELVEVAKDRVNIDDTIASEDKGYLLELDFRGNYDPEPYFYIDGYLNLASGIDLHSAVEFVIKSDISGQDDLNFIKNYIQEMHNAIVSGNRNTIEKYLDLPSFIDMYIIEEWSKDCDVGRASFYLQKEAGGKIYCTAPWDFDFGFGTYGPATSTYGLVSDGSGGVCPWYNALVQRSWFRKMVLDRMEELKDAFNETLSDLREKGKEIEGDADMNAYFWNMYGNSFHGYVSSQTSRYLYSYEEHIDFIVEWCEERWENMIEELKFYS